MNPVYKVVQHDASMPNPAGTPTGAGAQGGAMHQLRKISKKGVPAALDRAERYRLLNEAVDAESICLDVLEIAPNDQRALKVLILSLTDQFDDRVAEAFMRAHELLPRLKDQYSRDYFEGILCERRAKAHFRRISPGSGHVAHDWFLKAMDCYERAIKKRPSGEDEAILRWNSCARTLKRHPDLAPRQEEPVEQMLE